MTVERAPPTKLTIAPSAEAGARRLGLVPRRHVLVLGAVCAAAVVLAQSGRAAGGLFTSNDAELNAIWAASVRTARDMLVPGPIRVDWYGRDCSIGLSTVLVDGTVRDRCPYVGDEAVINRTLDASTPNWAVQRAMLAWFASAQHPDGSIPASPLGGGSLVLFDYNAYWLIALDDYVLDSGDLGLARQVWPHVVKLIDGFYARHTLPNGLLVNDLGPSDYAFIRRSGTVVAYFNAEYAYALTRTAQLATWLDHPSRAAAWRTRAHAVAVAFGSAFWDSRAGAFADTTTDFATHPQDGNAFAVLAGIATAPRSASALGYLWAHDNRSYGNTIVDDQAWDNPTWGIQANQRVYPFMSYFEVCARFEAGGDAEALDLIRREWGYMLDQGPGTMWETIGPAGGPPTGDKPSFDAGWSSGAAAALTRYVLGVVPTSPGFATFTVAPHLGDLEYAEGDVPTPHGPIHVAWKDTGGGLELGVSAPPGTRWERARSRLNPRLVGS